MKSRIGDAFGIFLGAIIAAAIFNLPVIVSDFDLLPGDLGDSRLCLFLLEHWFKVLQGQVGFSDLGMFYPYKNSLGFSDTLFLFGLIYAPFRKVGLDPFSAFQRLFFVLPLIGFCGFYLLLTKRMAVGRFVALLVAVVFVNLNGLKNQICHPQLLAVFLCLMSFTWVGHPFILGLFGINVFFASV